jgi:hypothetical protein
MEMKCSKTSFEQPNQRCTHMAYMKHGKYKTHAAPRDAGLSVAVGQCRNESFGAIHHENLQRISCVGEE